MQLPEIIFQLIVEFSWPHFFGSVIMQPSLIILHLQKMRIISSSDVDMLRLSGVALSSKVYLHTLCGLLFSLNYPHCHSLVETSLHPSSTLEGACPKLDSTTQNPLWSIPAWKCQHTLFFFSPVVMHLIGRGKSTCSRPCLGVCYSHILNQISPLIFTLV